jgi:hypothetical protein
MCTHQICLFEKTDYKAPESNEEGAEGEGPGECGEVEAIGDEGLSDAVKCLNITNDSSNCVKCFFLMTNNIIYNTQITRENPEYKEVSGVYPANT